MNYEKLMNPTITGMKPSGIRRFFDIANDMEDVISLSIGEPDFSTPFHIRDKGVESLEKGKTWYTSNAGMPRLREAISGYIKRHVGITYAPDTEILVTVGGSEGIDLCMRTLVTAGDEVLIPQPSFVCYEPLAQMAGGVAVPIVTRAEDGFRLTAQALKAAITPKTKLLVLPFPSNPTGAVMRREHLEAIAEVLRGTDIFVLSDEIYADLTYGEASHVSLASLDGMWERTVYVSGFSKSFAMTGWRLGYVCAPAPLMKQMTKVHQYALMCAPTVSQYAAIEAMENGDDDVKEMREDYDSRRRFIVGELNKMGLRCFDPEGAFYVFPSIEKTGFTAEDFCTQLLMEQHVAVVPGTAFGECGEGFVRISYCYSIAHITEAMKRIRAFLESRGLL
ncbi:MAG: aminotransferase class I/II-fold pyridoxal phosphate-dependent enzyme [Clostridia bacterium]|nr:aminotransferase class I/II-fold pyridoxal phosphate-dependent enzyme [Clostridia bacterium]